MIVVTGATGNVGQSLVQALVAAGEQVTAVSRKISDVPEGVRHQQADLAEPESLKTALQGAEALFLLTSPDFMANGDLGDVMKVVRAVGVGRVVLLSSHGVGTRRHPSRLEDAVKQSGLEWTMLRPGNFTSNAFQWADSVRAQRVVRAPFGDVAVPAIDPADIAEVAAVTLREDGHAGQIHELTGPALSTPRQQAEAIGNALAEPVRFEEQTRDEARAQMLRFMPEPVVDTTLDILGEPTPAEQRISPDAEQVLRRAPRTFADWAQNHIAAFR